MWSARASPEAVVTMLGRSPGHLPASLPGPSPRTSPRSRLVTWLALGQGLGGTRGPLPGMDGVRWTLQKLRFLAVLKQICIF